MNLSLTPLFWPVNRILTMVAAVKVWVVSLVSGFVWVTTNNGIFLIWKGVGTVSVPTFQYSNDCRSKNNDTQTRLAMDCWLSVNHWSVASRVWRVEIGIGWTRNGGFIIYCTTKAVIPD